jgi:hypothetical protein
MFRCPTSFGQRVWRELAVIVASPVPYGVILCHSRLAWRKRNDVEMNDTRWIAAECRMSCPREFKTDQQRRTHMPVLKSLSFTAIPKTGNDPVQARRLST